MPPHWALPFCIFNNGTNSVTVDVYTCKWFSWCIRRFLTSSIHLTRSTKIRKRPRWRCVHVLRKIVYKVHIFYQRVIYSAIVRHVQLKKRHFPVVFGKPCWASTNFHSLPFHNVLRNCNMLPSGFYVVRNQFKLYKPVYAVMLITLSS